MGSVCSAPSWFFDLETSCRLGGRRRGVPPADRGETSRGKDGREGSLSKSLESLAVGVDEAPIGGLEGAL